MSASFPTAETRFTEMYFCEITLKNWLNFLCFLIKALPNALVNNFNSYYRLYKFVLNISSANLSFPKRFSHFNLNAPKISPQ